MLRAKFRLGLIAVSLVVIIISGCTPDIMSDNVEHSTNTIAELKTILNELDDEAAKNTVQELIDATVEIERTFKTVDNKYHFAIYTTKKSHFLNENLSEGSRSVF